MVSADKARPEATTGYASTRVRVLCRNLGFSLTTMRYIEARSRHGRQTPGQGQQPSRAPGVSRDVRKWKCFGVRDVYVFCSYLASSGASGEVLYVAMCMLNTA